MGIAGKTILWQIVCSDNNDQLSVSHYPLQGHNPHPEKDVLHIVMWSEYWMYNCSQTFNIYWKCTFPSIVSGSLGNALCIKCLQLEHRVYSTHYEVNCVNLRAYLLTASILGLGFELFFCVSHKNQDTPRGYRLQMGNLQKPVMGTSWSFGASGFSLSDKMDFNYLGYN